MEVGEGSEDSVKLVLFLLRGKDICRRHLLRPGEGEGGGAKLFCVFGKGGVGGSVEIILFLLRGKGVWRWHSNWEQKFPIVFTD